MMIVAALLLAAAAPEDAAHRADRLRTGALNRQAAAIVDRRLSRNEAAQARYGAAVRAHEARLAAWRRAVAACHAGDVSACRDDQDR